MSQAIQKRWQSCCIHTGLVVHKKKKKKTHTHWFQIGTLVSDDTQSPRIRIGIGKGKKWYWNISIDHQAQSNTIMKLTNVIPQLRAEQIQHVLTAYKEERRERGGREEGVRGVMESCVSSCLTVALDNISNYSFWGPDEDHK